jgi:hypothetical protein
MDTRWLRLVLVAGLLLMACCITVGCAAGPTDIPYRGTIGGNDSAASSGNQGVSGIDPPGAPGRNDGAVNNDTQTSQPTPSPTTPSETHTSPPAETATTVQTSPGERPEKSPSGTPAYLTGAGNRFSSSRLGLAIIAGLLLGAVVLVPDLSRRRRLPADHPYRRASIVLFATMAFLIAVALSVADIRDQGWAILLIALAVSLISSAAGISYGFLRKIWLPRTLWFHAGSAAVLAFALPFVIVSTTGRAESALPLGVLLAASAGISFWQIRAIPPAGEPTRAGGSPTIVGTPDPGRFDLPASFLEMYSEVALVATGGLARVYRARRRADGRIVALKLPLNANETTGACFMREILAWKDLVHPNIVRILNANILPVPAVEMEYIEQSLADVKRPVPVEKAVRLVRGIANGLAYAHQQGVIHRDIKPENILLTPDETPKITDWGMSRIASACNLPTVVGFSPAYAAPEQIAPARFGTTDARTDIFQLGVVFYELVTGRVPFAGEGILEITSSILSTDPPRPSSLVSESGTVEPIILRCLQRDPADRYQSITTMLRDLDLVQGST